MSLRGAVQDFPLETVVRLIAATAKTGQLELRGDGTSGSLGFDAGRLVAANSGEDVGEPALGAVFSIAAGDFEFVPWNDPPAANLAGGLDQLLERAAAERDRVLADREVIGDDRLRFALSERAASQGEITLSSEQWRALLAVNGERDLGDIARQLKLGRLATLSILARLVRAGMLDTLEPGPAASEPPAPQAPPEPSARSWATAAPSWEAPAAPSWESAAPSWEPAAAAEAPAEATAAEAAPLDDRLSALSGIFGGPAPATEAETDPRLAAFGQPAAPTAAEAPPSAEAPAGLEEAREEKKKGLFGRFKKEEAAPSAGAPSGVRNRAGRLAAFANALLDEYNSGQYGKGRIDDRMTNLVMRVDEQADPIDRPLPILDDRIDVSALERVDMPAAQSGPYLALLSNQIYGDAEKAFGRDKAKKGYLAARQRIFGSDTSWLAGFDIAGKLPKV